MAAESLGSNATASYSGLLAAKPMLSTAPAAAFWFGVSPFEVKLMLLRVRVR